MRGQSQATVDVEWNIAIKSPLSKEVPQEDLRQKALEKRDAYRFDISSCYPTKLVMIIDDIFIKKGIIKDLSAGGISCDFFEPIELSPGQRVRLRFRLEMEDPAIIKTEAIYRGTSGAGLHESEITRFDFSEILGESDQDRIHQYILIKQLEMFRANRRKFDY